MAGVDRVDRVDRVLVETSHDKPACVSPLGATQLINRIGRTPTSVSVVSLRLNPTRTVPSWTEQWNSMEQYICIYIYIYYIYIIYIHILYIHIYGTDMKPIWKRYEQQHERHTNDETNCRVCCLRSKLAQEPLGLPQETTQWPDGK